MFDTALSAPLLAEWLVGARNVVFFVGACVILALIVQRWMVIPRNVGLVAAHFGLMFEREGRGLPRAWGTLADGRRINIHAKAKPKGGVDMLVTAVTLLPLPTRRTNCVEIGLDGAAMGDVPADDRHLFLEYAHRALPAAIAARFDMLAPAGLTDVQLESGLLRARGVRFGLAPQRFIDAIDALAEVAREVEHAAHEQLAEVRGRPAPSPSPALASRPPSPPQRGIVPPAPRSPSPTAAGLDDEALADNVVVPESVVCPHCDARTPTDTGRCQMCGKRLDEAPAPPDDEYADDSAYAETDDDADAQAYVPADAAADALSYAPADVPNDARPPAASDDFDAM